MKLEQYYLGCLAHASYLIGDEGNGTAVVVDPQRDVDRYVEAADENGLQIRHVFLTHFHADFVAGHLELRDRTDAQIHLGARARAEYAFVPMSDGASLEIGQVRLEVLETPGHSPESICILVFDLDTDADTPHAVLSGDTLFIGDVGRPDLRASPGRTAEQLGAMLYDSLHAKLLTLPDEVLLYPTHGAGSLCGKNLSEDTVSTIGVQRRYNYALQPMEREEFIAIVTADQPDVPDYFSHDVILNTVEHATLEKSLEQSLRPMTLAEVTGLAGGQLLDVRESTDFLGAHLQGSINIGLDGRYATWAGTLLDPERPIAIIAEPGRELEAQVRLGRIGFDNIAGFLQGGMAALDHEPTLVRRTDRVTAAHLADELKKPGAPAVLDVRAVAEWRESHIAGSINIPLNQLPDRLGELSRADLLVAHCASGYRSATAISLLEANDFEVVDLVGGLSAWEAARLQTESEA